jgi:hypothetical protein
MPAFSAICCLCLVILATTCTAFRSTVSSSLLQRSAVNPSALAHAQTYGYATTTALRCQSEDYDENGFTQKQILKEETEAPFRKVRVFLIIALLAAAGVGTLVSLTKVLAITAGARQLLDGDETYQNFGINLAGIPVLSYLWKREIDSQ